MSTCSVQTVTTHLHPPLTLMGSGTGSRSGSSSSSASNSPRPIKKEPVDDLPSSAASTPLITPPIHHSPPVGLLNTRNLVQDEKLVVATLASLNSGDPSNIIKQDLRLIIQSRRKAEGKGELTVDFRTPPKDELTAEEWERVHKRRDQNRRAAQRFRQKQRKLSSTLSERVRQLEASNILLRFQLKTLEGEKLKLFSLCYQHMKECKNFDEKLRLQQALGFGYVNIKTEKEDSTRWPT